jgi:predicted transcriptional regulator
MTIKEVTMEKAVEFKKFSVSGVYVNIKLIYDFCAENNISIQKFCDAVRIHRASFYQYREGKSPSLPIRSRIQKFTGIPSEQLFTKNGKSQSGRVCG